MDVLLIAGTILTTSILLQFITAFLALRLIRVTGIHIAWVAIATAILFMAVRRCITLFRLISGDVAYQPDPTAELIALVTSTLLLVGVALIAPLFLSITRSEDALQKSEARLSNAQRIAHVGNWDWNVITNNLYWSDEIYRIFGLPPHEFGATYEAFLNSVHPDDREHVKNSVNNALYENTPCHIDHRIVLPDGEVRIVHEHAEVTVDESGKPIRMAGTVQDITEGKRADETLRAASLYARSLIEASLDPLFTIGKDGRIMDVNHATEVMTGVSRERLIGSDFSDYFTEPEKAREGYQQIFSQGFVTDCLLTIRNTSGRVTDVLYNATVYRNEAGEVQGVFAAARDITERKQAEGRIEHLNSVLEAIRNVNQLIVTEKDRDSILKKACDLLIDARGYDTVWLGSLSDDETFDMVVGSGFAEDVSRFSEGVIAGDHPPCIKNALARNDVFVADKSEECGDCFFKSTCLGKEAAIFRVEHAGRLFGLLAILRASGVAVDEEEKSLLKEVASDIGFALHDMEVEEAHKAAEDRIKASLKEKEVLLREIHHRVKNNLQVVSSLLDMQARGCQDEDTINILTESKNRLNAMALIHAQLYESSDLAEVNMKGFVNKLLMQLFQSYQVQGTTIAHTVSVADYPVPISMAVPVGLIVNELLSNALKYAFVGRKEGRLEVSLTASEEGRINLTVSDDGVGLPAGFDINATKTLGLRLVKILTEDQLRGTLTVISKEGTTFNIEFDIITNGGV